jgi:hypothetical protein
MRFIFSGSLSGWLDQGEYTREGVTASTFVAQPVHQKSMTG